MPRTLGSLQEIGRRQSHQEAPRPTTSMSGSQIHHHGYRCYIPMLVVEQAREKELEDNEKRLEMEESEWLKQNYKIVNLG